MSLSVDYIYNFALKLIKKNMAGGLGNVDFQYKWNDASSSYQDDLLGRFQMRANGKTGLNTGLIEDETILQKLTPFTKSVTILTTNGIATKPTDFVYRLAERSNQKDVFKIRHNQIASVVDSVIDPPSIANNTYYFVEYLDYFLVFPALTPYIDLDYISTPTDIVWGYTWDEMGRQKYSAILSVQPQWDNSSCREITKRMLKTLGISFKDNDFVNFGQSVIQSGE